MSGQFLLTVLNPVVSLCCAALMGYLARLLPNRGHLLMLCVAFIYLALGFISQDVHGLSRPGAINYAGNMLFFSAVALATASTMMRVGVPVPIRTYAVITVATLAGFTWFAGLSPSLTGRLVVIGAGFAAFSLVALHRLVTLGPRTAADRLVVAGLAIAVVLSLGRPVLALMGVLSVNPAGYFEDSDYWASIRALTPVVAVMVAALFATAITLDTIDRLREQANRDYLTGLLNRRGFELGAKALLDAAPSGQHSALLLADVDDFKTINDTYGHDVGDRVLVDIGRLLTEDATTPIAGRTGGEEFALFYAEITPEALQSEARRILARLREARMPGLPEDRRVSISIGLHLRSRDEDLSAMMRQADAALYDAKRAGKDRVILARTLRRA